MTKEWWKSKTLWFNVVTVVLGIVAAIVGVVETKLWVIVLTGVMGAGNAVLRIWFTDTAISK